MAPLAGRGGGLEYHYGVLQRTVLRHQDPTTGLLPAHQVRGCETHAWIRDNVYSITAVWALALAYRRQPGGDGQARSYTLEKATVRCMRGLLAAMLGQREKVERFKTSFSPLDSLHAKYSSETGRPVVGDHEWGHLQIDAVSLFLLSLAQMTAGGLQIIFSLDEVAFVQNLVFYIECAYVTPDFGMWERGAKSNRGIPELNASSIGMAKAALEALSELDLFGGQGSPGSVIHVLPDEAVKCSAVLESMLPRESNSKETDAALHTVIGFPAFAVNSQETIKATLETLRAKLRGRYGLKRFLRDGYRTVQEDPGRNHYEPWELRVFDRIECEWPLFLCYEAINHLFEGESEEAEAVLEALDRLAVPCEGLKLLPELYLVPRAGLAGELAAPGSAEREPAGRLPFMWAQCLLTVARLLHEGLLAPAELDPMNRRLCSAKKPEALVQVVVLAEDEHVQALLAEQGVAVRTVLQVSPLEVKSARVLSHLYTFLGRSTKLGLSGRSCLDVGILATSKVYSIQGKLFVFTPQNFDRSSNYADMDSCLAVSSLEHALNCLATSWSAPGRPTVTLVAGPSMLEEGAVPPAFVTALRKLEGGYINGTRVELGSHAGFGPTSCTTELAFLGSIEEGRPEVLHPEVAAYLARECGNGLEVREGVLGTAPERRRRLGAEGRAMRGAMRRSRSICPTAETSRAIARELQLLGLRDAEEVVEEVAVVEEEVFSLVPAPRRRLDTLSDVNYETVELEELLDTLRASQDMEEQGDILHYMAATHGMAFPTGLGTVQELLRELHQAACCAPQHWSIVRHASGLLGKRIPGIALSLTDLLVRQKQVTVGLPPDNETVLECPLGAAELSARILRASDGDMAASTLSQEILVYLAMFVRTEPGLFTGMLRLRVGLILQVMVSELSRSIPGISDEEATDRLLNLSPFETNNLLHHLLSGQEYRVVEGTGGRVAIVLDTHSLSLTGRSTGSLGLGRVASVLGPDGLLPEQHEDGEDEGSDRVGLWLRRRLLDGSLNRVPAGFYTRLWDLLDRCRGLQVGTEVLDASVCQEMTSGEMDFHLKCEQLLNSVPEPEFRQLVVEALLVLVLVVEHKVVLRLGCDVIRVEDIVRAANALFLEDQRKQEGDALLCCVVWPGQCGGAAGVCRHFYDSAPSGPWGTMAYLVRGACRALDSIPEDGVIDCSIM